MKIEVGKSYLDKQGRIVTIISKSKDHQMFFTDKNSKSKVDFYYTDNGTCIRGSIIMHSLRLVKEIPNNQLTRALYED